MTIPVAVKVGPYFSSPGHTAFGFQRAVPAIMRAGPVNEHVVLVRPAGGLKHLALRAEIDIALFVEAEVFAREGAIVSLALVPDRDAGPFGCGRCRQSPDFLMAELPERLKKAPMTFHLKAQLAAPGDPTNDRLSPGQTAARWWNSAC